MIHERYRLVAAVIAAHTGSRIVGRTRLQKTIRILQSLGLPTNYGYTSHFYGPYSEELQMDMGILQSLELVEEMQQTSMDGSNYFVLTAKHTSSLPDISGFTSYTDVMEKSEPVVLELAATYLCFRESGSEHFDALERLRRKKGDKCEEGREEKALSLLRSFKLPSGAKDARYGNRRQIR